MSRGILLFNPQTSEDSLLPKGAPWIGIPPGSPWLAWFGPDYVPYVGPRAMDEGLGTGVGLLWRSHPAPATMDVAVANQPALPDELIATRPDPRFWGVPPSVPAVVIPASLIDPPQVR